MNWMTELNLIFVRVNLCIPLRFPLNLVTTHLVDTLSKYGTWWLLGSDYLEHIVACNFSFTKGRHFEMHNAHS
jgi:hypothetical protein